MPYLNAIAVFVLVLLPVLVLAVISGFHAVANRGRLVSQIQATVRGAGTVLEPRLDAPAL